MPSSSRPMTFRRLLAGGGIALLCLAAGGGLFALAKFTAHFDDDIKGNGVRTEAVIVDRWTEDHDGVSPPGSQLGGRDYTSCHIRVSYTPDGSEKPIEAEATVLDGEYAEWNEAKQQFEDIAIGTKVPIFYLPDNPERIETVHSIENAPSGLVGTILLIVFAVLVMGLGLLGAYFILFVDPPPPPDANVG